MEKVLYNNIGQLLTLAGVAKKQGRAPTESDLGIIENAAMVVDSATNKIEWIGEQKNIPTPFRKLVNQFSSEGEVWLPELVECHTHLVCAGNRHHDYAQRCAGKTYQEIAAAGGGILTTLKHTREAGYTALYESALKELERFQKFGVGAVEIKTGYGLTLESEIEILEVIAALQKTTSLTIVPTFMPAHATPPEYKDRTDAFVDVICQEWIPEVAKRNLAEYFDAFVEKGFFDVTQTRRMCEVALQNGLKLKLHCDQFNDIGGTDLGLELGVQSIDHLDHVSDANIQKLGKADTVAVLLPGASLYTGTPYPPARKLIDAGARVAVSTDFNPGTSPSRNLPLMTTLACSQMKMTVPEAVVSITYNAAAALGLENTLGTLEVGKEFRVCSLRADSYEVLPYSFGEIE